MNAFARSPNVSHRVIPAVAGRDLCSQISRLGGQKPESIRVPNFVYRPRPTDCRGDETEHFRFALFPGFALGILLGLGISSVSLGAPSAPDAPVFVAQISNPNDYSLFATSGWDGNWYVGYNNGWIKKLPPIPKGDYARAYLGAKLGRMKTLPPEGKPPVFNPVPGELWMAISAKPSWAHNQKTRLTYTDDIPLEGSPEYALEHTGESEWFWVEVPLDRVNLSGPNYLVLWSPSPKLISVSSAPVLAAAWGGKEIDTWLARDLKGEPPGDPKTALKSGLSLFQPALALKLIPSGPLHPMRVRITRWTNGTPDHLKPIIEGSVEGESVERVWMEYNHGSPSADYKQVGRSLWKAPFAFSIDQEKLPKGKVRLRMVACNIWEERAESEPVEIEVSQIHAKK